MARGDCLVSLSDVLELTCTPVEHDEVRVVFASVRVGVFFILVQLS